MILQNGAFTYGRWWGKGGFSGGEKFGTSKFRRLVYSCANHSAWDTQRIPKKIFWDTHRANKSFFQIHGIQKGGKNWDTHWHKD